MVKNETYLYIYLYISDAPFPHTNFLQWVATSLISNCNTCLIFSVLALYLCTGHFLPGNNFQYPSNQQVHLNGDFPNTIFVSIAVVQCKQNSQIWYSFLSHILNHVKSITHSVSHSPFCYIHKYLMHILTAFSIPSFHTTCSSYIASIYCTYSWLMGLKLCPYLF